MSFARQFAFLFAISAVASPAALADGPQVSAESRLATFVDAAGGYFALSVAADNRADYPEADRFEVVVLFDTSATQTGQIRRDALEVLEELPLSLPTSAEMALMACDVKAVELSAMSPVSDPAVETGMARLRKRIPLGTTDLAGAVEAAVERFGDAKSQKTILYIGDGVNRSKFRSRQEQRKLVEQLAEKQIAFSAFAIGPFVDMPTLAALANQTGGIVLADANIQESNQSIGRYLAHSTSTPVLWVEKVELPGALAGHFPARFPPLRLDRDTVVVGELAEGEKDGELVLLASAAGEKVAVRTQITAEPSHPDMGFLASVVDAASRDGGVSLPTLGSDGLRAMSVMLASTAEAMVKSGKYALQSGQVDSAIRIAKEALKKDPNSEAARRLLREAEQKEESAIPTGRFTQLGGEPPQRGVEFDSAGDLLAEEEALRRSAAAALKTEIEVKLKDARVKSDTDPTGVKNSLKLLLEELDAATSLDPTVVTELQEKIQSAIQITAAKEARYLDRVQRSEAIRSQADQVQRLLAETNRREETLKNLVQQFNFLMAEQEFLVAKQDVAPEVGRLVPDSALHNVTREVSSLASNQALLLDVFELREQGFVDAMRGVEAAAVPFDGVPPLVYPPADVWQALSADRKERYGSINLAGGGSENEQRIFSSLKQNITADYPGQPLQTVMQGIGDDMNIPIWINEAELDVLGIDLDSQISLSLPAPVSLRSALRLMLKPLELTYIVRNEVLEITTIDSANAEPINKVYPVGDLVVPPINMGGGGMMGGGMGGMGGGMGGMGGGMGGMGGGMGGMGGGMGGMGGGMGGMGGGMGGGMFFVPDDNNRTQGRSPLSLNHSVSTSEAQQWVERFEAADDEQRVLLDSELRREIQSKVETASDYLAGKAQKQAVAEFQSVIDIVGGLLGAGYPAPWMYQTLGLSMEACDYPADDIQRVMLSGLDFEGNANQAVKLAEYFVARGMKAEALELLHDVAKIEPYRYDVFSLALPLASETGDVDALRWATLGVLSKAWPKERAAIYQDAELKAKLAAAMLRRDGRLVEASAFESEVEQARVRDLAVRVTWSGEADLDLRVREPAGTVCSLSNPQTASGGVLLGDSSHVSGRQGVEGTSEFYVCSEGFSGQYDILVKKIWGDTAGGRATVEIFTDFGKENQQRIVKQVDISDKDVVIQVAVRDGQRQESIAEAQVAGIRQQQMQMAESVLGQFGGEEDSDDYYNARRALAAAAAAANQRRAGIGFPRAGAVGYMPIITQLPEGAFMSVNGVVSADRRYVRISPSPFFSGIGEVFTFNFITGAGGGGAGGGGLGGGGLGGGGLGGGGGGIGGGGGGFGF